MSSNTATPTSRESRFYQGPNSLPIEVITYKPLSNPRPTPLLFVHGAWHGAWCWEEYFLPYFGANGYESYALNLRGHGQSQINGSLRFTRIADYLTDVEAVAAQLSAPPVLVGHSMGSFIIEKYLEKHQAPAAVLLAPPPPWGLRGAALQMARTNFPSFLKTNLRMSLYAAVDTPEKARQVLFSADMPDDQELKYFRKLTDDSFLAYIDMLALALPDPKRSTSPVLVLAAAGDPNFSAREIEATARAYHGSYEIFPKMAHNLMLEQGWESVAARIATWLSAKGI